MARMVLRKEAALLFAAAALTLAGGSYAYLARATTLRIAVAPNGGTEPLLLQAFAEALAKTKKDVRLTLITFEGVEQSAAALQAGKVDLAVVRPDVRMPDNGLTLAILREQAVLVLAREASGVAAITDLAGKRLGFFSARLSDRALIEEVLDQAGLASKTSAESGAPARRVDLVPLDETRAASALAAQEIDALLLVTTPANPAARRLVGQAARADRALCVLGVPDGAAMVERLPKIQPTTVPAGLLGGDPRLPAEDLSTIGASYRLMARATLSRSTAAALTQHLFALRAGLAEAHPSANFIKAPAYDTTAEATSARLPIHPGAIDYFEREQESFVERNEVWIYLALFFGGGVITILEWLRQHLSRVRRERIETATEKLLRIRLDARKTSDPATLGRMAREIDDLAASIARFALSKPVEPRTMSAASIAIDAARASLRQAETKPPPTGVAPPRAAE